ncbi:MAG: hypothetical protein NVSMB56_12830 [Pyrinomonadaceae bacterium]
MACGREYAETSEVCEADGAELVSVDYIFDAPITTSEIAGDADNTIEPKVGEVASPPPPLREAELAALERAKQDQLEAQESEIHADDPVNRHEQWKAVFLVVFVFALGFGGYYLYGHRNEQLAQNDQSPPLTSDPNAKPFKSITPPNGEAEKDISVNSTISPTDAQGTNTQTGATDTTKSKDGLVSPIKTTGEVYDTNAPTDSPFIPPPDNTKVYKTDNATGAALVSEASSGAKNEKNKNAKNANDAANANSDAKNRNVPRNANAKDDANANRNATAPRAPSSPPKPVTQPPTEKKSAQPTGKADEKKTAPPRE